MWSMTFLACHPAVTQITSGKKHLVYHGALWCPKLWLNQQRHFFFPFVRSHIWFCYHSWQRQDTEALIVGNVLQFSCLLSIFMNAHIWHVFSVAPTEVLLFSLLKVIWENFPLSKLRSSAQAVKPLRKFCGMFWQWWRETYDTGSSIALKFIFVILKLSIVTFCNHISDRNISLFAPLNLSDSYNK